MECLGSTVLRTCFRVMKPAGKLLLTTNFVGHMHEFYEVYRAVPQELGLVDRLTALDAHVHHRATIASVRRMLTGAGFEPWRWSRTRCGCAARTGRRSSATPSSGWASSQHGSLWCCLTPWSGPSLCSSSSATQGQQSVASWRSPFPWHAWRPRSRGQWQYKCCDGERRVSPRERSAPEAAA